MASQVNKRHSAEPSTQAQWAIAFNLFCGPRFTSRWHSVPLKPVVLFFSSFFFCFSTSKNSSPSACYTITAEILPPAVQDLRFMLTSTLHNCRHDTTYCIIRTLLNMAVFKLGICSCLACVYRVMDAGGSLESTNVPKEFLEAQPRATLAS